ncbi:MAG TPA: hypothetical protein VLE72_03160 [Candidatus Saccharimonadales bacterium]|nr:hypothetical protein [Candidatus Saccharimonadales bacterium]
MAASSKVPAVTPFFEGVYVLLCAWFLGGLYFDAWSHTHHPELESFINVPHGVLYSGFMGLAALVFFTAWRNHRAGFSFKRCMPAGYQTAFWATILFLIAGAGDAIWHTLFGIEHQLEAAFSPTHIGIMIGLTILVSAPFMSAWRRGIELDVEQARAWPGILGFTYLLSAFTLVTQWAHPYVEQVLTVAPLDVNQGQALGILGFMLQVSILVGLALLVMRRGIARSGLFTVALTLNALVLALMRGSFEVVPAALLTGLAADVLLERWQSSGRSILGLRIYATTLGAVFAATYFIVIFATKSVWWSVHMWTGAIVVSAIFGLLISYLVVPPPNFGEPAK